MRLIVLEGAEEDELDFSTALLFLLLLY